MFAKGAKVTQAVSKPIDGVVEGFSVDQETGSVLVRVAYTDEAGAAHVRYFREDDLQAAD